MFLDPIPAPPERVPAPPLQRPSILVVEDEHTIRDVIALLLSEEGYRVEEAADGSLALKALTSLPTPPALVLLDLQLPRLSGEELLAHMKRHPIWRSIPVVVMTATAKRCDNPQVVAHLAKPIELKEVLLLAQKFASREPHFSPWHRT